MEVFENLDINNLENEVWKVIEDFPDYQVSNLSRVKSFKKWHGTNERILKQCKDTDDYFIVNLYKNKEDKSKKVHVLVFETFNNYKLKDYECVHHIDENKENNILSNLIIMSKSDHNSFHNKNEKSYLFGKHQSEKTKNKISKTRKEKFKNGELNLKGENNPMFGKTGYKSPRFRTKLSEETKRKISNSHKLISNQKIIDIQSDIENGNLTQRETAKRHGVSQMTISRIKNGKFNLKSEKI